MRNAIVSVLALCGLAVAEDTVVRIYVSLDREHSEAVLRRFSSGFHGLAVYFHDPTSFPTLGVACAQRRCSAKLYTFVVGLGSYRRWNYVHVGHPRELPNSQTHNSASRH